MSERPPYGPNALLQIERSLTALDGFEIDTRTKLQVLMTVDTYVTGSVLHELREVRVDQTHSKTETAQAEAHMRARRDRLDRSSQFVRVVPRIRRGNRFGRIDNSGSTFRVRARVRPDWRQ